MRREPSWKINKGAEGGSDTDLRRVVTDCVGQSSGSRTIGSLIVWVFSGACMFLAHFKLRCTPGGGGGGGAGPHLVSESVYEQKRIW